MNTVAESQSPGGNQIVMEPASGISERPAGLASGDEDDLWEWASDWSPPPAPSRRVRGVSKHVGWAPIPRWTTEDLEPDAE